MTCLEPPGMLCVSPMPIAIPSSLSKLRGSELRSLYGGHVIKTQLQLVCCALVQELGCLVILGGQSEGVSGMRCGVDRGTWNLNGEGYRDLIGDFSQLQTEVQLPKCTGLYMEREWG